MKGGSGKVGLSQVYRADPDGYMLVLGNFPSYVLTEVVEGGDVEYQMMSALLTAISPLNLIYMLAGTVLGILIGAAPGLGPVFALAILLPMTYSMSATSSVIFLSAVYGACCYGGSISAILLNTPAPLATWLPALTVIP